MEIFIHFIKFLKLKFEILHLFFAQKYKILRRLKRKPKG